MNSETQSIINTIVGLMAIMGFIGTVLGTFILGHMHGRNAVLAWQRMFNWFISKEVLPPSEHILLINLTRSTFHCQVGSDVPMRVLVELPTHTVDLNGTAFKVGVPIGEMQSPQTDKQPFALVAKESVH